jgi:VanZ family protein
MGIEPRYGLLTLAWLAAIYWLSSRPELGTTEAHPLVALTSNLMHMPLFAGLAFLLLKTFSAGQEISWRLYAVVLLVTAGYAALDEWHQSFVPGRFASVGDFLLDVMGIVAMMLILRFMALREANS